MTTPETTVNEALLPPIPSADAFENPFNALVAAAIWNNEILADNETAVIETIKKLHPDEAFALAKHIDTLGGEIDEGVPAPSVWRTELRDVKIDEYGLIHAIAGDSRVIKARILGEDPIFDEVYFDENVSKDILLKLIELFEADLYSAAANRHGNQRAILFTEKLEAELARRSNLPSIGTESMPVQDSRLF